MNRYDEKYLDYMKLWRIRLLSPWNYSEERKGHYLFGI